MRCLENCTPGDLMFSSFHQPSAEGCREVWELQWRHSFKDPPSQCSDMLKSKSRPHHHPDLRQLLAKEISSPYRVQKELRETKRRSTDNSEVAESVIEKEIHQKAQQQKIKRDGAREKIKMARETCQNTQQQKNVSIAPKRRKYQGDTGVAVSIVVSLKDCAKKKDLRRGCTIHDDIAKRGLLQRNVFVGSTLVNMYAKCGALEKAQEVFDKLQIRNVVSWNALLAGYAQHGHGEKALICFEQMQGDGFSPDVVTFACALKACGCIGALDRGKEIHAQIRRDHVLQIDIVIGTALVDMYGKCGELEKAQDVFNQLPMWNVISWNSLISGYAQHGHGQEALECFERMRLEGFSPDVVTFVSVLKACGSIGASDKGQELHAQIVRERLWEEHAMVANALVDMYAKCAVFDRAREVFDQLPVRNLVSWTALISGYAQHGHGKEALSCFDSMKKSGVSPDAVTFACILKACGSIGNLVRGQEIHAQIEREHLLEKYVVVANALINMYAKCGALEKAQDVFDELPIGDLVSWNTLIAGYVDHGEGKKALSCFEQMQLAGFSPNAATFACILKACSSIGALDKGKGIHAQIMREHGLERDVVVGSALVDMYAKCGALQNAQEVFDMLLVRNIVSWNVLIAGYVHEECGEEALKCFKQMQFDGFSPNAVTFACIVKACGSIGAACKGQKVHADIVKHGCPEKGTVICIELVVMYSNCGMLAEAQDLFEKLPTRDEVTWSAIMVGCAQLGKDEVILKLFDKMIREGVVPNLVTFTVVLNACSHLGLLDRGELYFEIISKGYGIIPTLEHHTCMIDLFGRAGRLDKAVTVIEETPLSADLTMWLALLGACQQLRNKEVGRWAFENALELNENNPSAYIHMRNMYGDARRHEDAGTTYVAVT